MKRYHVTGMSCAACAARVEKTVNKVPGVTACSVSLLTNSMGVEGNAPESEIIAAVKNAGYGASVEEQARPTVKSDDDPLKDNETPVLKKRLIVSVGFLLLLMYLSMGHGMWGWPLPAWLDGNHVAVGLLQLLLSGIIMVINQKFFISGFRSLWHKAPNMDTLVALGSGASFMWSTVCLFLMTDALLKGDSAAVIAYMDDLYFESAAMILTLITIGKMLEARSKGRTTDALKGLMKLAPQRATLLRDGKEVSVSVNEVRINDIFVVRPGESIPVDGVVTEGSGAVNEAALTGESIPVDKTVGSRVSAATINQSGFLTCRATRVGQDTTLSRIIKMVSDAAATKAPIAKIADKVSGVFVPAVIGVSVLTLVLWLIIGRNFGYALARGISVLVISCPCALGLATPVAIMVGNGVGAKNGILFKTAISLEETGKTQIVVLDKTGTITVGQPQVTEILAAEGVREQDLLQFALDLEAKSEHSLAKAITDFTIQKGMSAREVDNFSALPGNGLTASYDGNPILGGSMRYISSLVDVPENIREKIDTLVQEGKTPLLFACANQFLGAIAVADTIKEDSPRAIAELRNMGIRTVMLTGDNERTAKVIGSQAGVDEVIADVLPGEKESVICELKRQGKVTMVGDGINDAPALTRADTGIAIGAGSDIAIDAADVVLMKNSLEDVPAAIRLSRATLRNIHENLFWAFVYNVIGIPLAAGVFVPLGLTLNPMFGAAAMSLSSFCVVSNALRLNLCRLYDSSRDHKRKKSAPREAKKIRRVIHVEGMMCSHCENVVRSALEGIPQAQAVEVSHEAGTAVVTLSAKVADEILKKAIEDEGYTVLSME